jgi:hypothetical protein
VEACFYRRIGQIVARGDSWGQITKQGSSIVRFLLVEAAQVTVRSLPEWRSPYFHLAMRRGRKTAKVAMARKLALVSGPRRRMPMP